MRAILLAVILATSLPMFAQKGKTPPKTQPIKAIVTQDGPQIEFPKKIHDFGKINIDIQYATTRFTFINTGNKPLKITNVVTSCGCTTPDWSRDSIKPGDSGFVEARYETINRPGSFRKTITVYSNAVNEPFIHLDILGDVYKDVAEHQANVPDYGHIYFDKPTVEFNPLYDKGADSIKVRLINGSLFSTEFDAVGNLPPYCKVYGMPKSLEPNENAVLTIVLDGRMISRYGFGAFEIPIASNSTISPNLGLYVAYTRKQYFPKMSAKQLAKAPKIKFNMANDVIDFGSHMGGEILDTTITITNTGKQDLVLHEVYPECTCILVDFNKKVLKPGESVTVKVVFDTVTKSGTSTQSIWIVSNDPQTPEKFIYIKALLPKKIRKCQTCPD